LADRIDARNPTLLSAADRHESGSGALGRRGLMEPLIVTGLPRYRAIVALDIERSTSRPDPVKAELRNKTYELFDAALCSAGIRRRHRDRYIDRGDGLLALIHPVDQAPKALLLNRAIPALSRLLTDYNASLPHNSRPQRQLRIRVVTHAGDVRYDANGCFGEALDVAFRLLDAHPVKKALGETADSLILAISGDIYSSVVRHSYDGIDQHAFHPLVRVQIAGKRYPGWSTSLDKRRSRLLRWSVTSTPADEIYCGPSQHDREFAEPRAQPSQRGCACARCSGCLARIIAAAERRSVVSCKLPAAIATRIESSWGTVRPYRH
jgi:class 3 adenylate cyclase